MLLKAIRRGPAVFLLLSCTSLFLHGCGGDDDNSSSNSVQMYSIGGSVAGLNSGSVTLMNGADAVTVSANGTFRFPAAVSANTAYSVSVSSQPQGQICAVSNGSGTAAADVMNVSVACSTSTYAVGGTLSGLVAGMQVTLNNNGADPLTLNANGTFTFPARVAYAGSYLVTVGTQPTGQTCTVTQGSGSSVTTDVSSVSVICSTDVYTIGGTLSGLAASAQVTLKNNGTDPLTLTSDGTFHFATPIPHGGAYSAAVGTYPGGQFCAVSNSFGTSVTGNVSNISVRCFDSPVVFSTPGNYTWTVPAGVTSIHIIATGGGGGGGGNSSGVYAGTAGGAGAVVSVTRNVTPGDVLQLSIGAGGGGGTDTPVQGGGGFTCATGGGGGGSTNVDVGTANQIIAGGGGGGGSCGGTDGGSGGGPGGAGGNGITAANSNPGGQGGSAGIGGGAIGPGAAGHNGAGGAGGSAANNSSILGGAGGIGVGTGTGGSPSISNIGAGGGGYGGGGSGGFSATGGGAGGSIGPAGTVYAPGSNGGSESHSGGHGLVVITAQ